jgi:hypothetical protein
MTDLDTAAAERVHYATDPRIRQLAEARWRLTTGSTRDQWLALGKDNPEALIREARDWVRAAVAAGILPPPERNTDMDRIYAELKASRPDLYGTPAPSDPGSST